MFINHLSEISLAPRGPLAVSIFAPDLIPLKGGLATNTKILVLIPDDVTPPF